MNAQPQNSFTAEAPLEPATTKPRKRRALLPALALVVLGGAGFYGWSWWTTGRFLETTDDAYLQADKVTVAPRIAGVAAQVFVRDNQPVQAELTISIQIKKQ